MGNVTTGRDSVVEVEDLRITFGGTEVVHGISFSVYSGEMLALVGESGCGKSVSALALARLLPPAPVCDVRGHVQFDGADVLSLPPSSLRALRRNGIGYVFQDPAVALHPSLTIGYQMCEALEGGRLHRRKRAMECLGLAGLRDPAALMEAYPFTLSGGMQQRVVIAMALAREPKLLVADEPTTALDVTIQAQILDLLAHLQKRMGMAMLLITHNLGLVASRADRVCVMYAGHLVETGPVETILQRPAHPYTQGLLDVVPKLEGHARLLEGIPGMVPSGGESIPGCPFSPRCRYAQAICSSENPHLQMQGLRGRDCAVACHFPLQPESGAHAS